MDARFEPIMTKMLSYFDIPYTPEYCKKEGWFREHQWTKEQEQEFVDWLSEYLYNNTDARKLLMTFPQKNKRKIKEVATLFTCWYGWETKKENND